MAGTGLCKSVCCLDLKGQWIQIRVCSAKTIGGDYESTSLLDLDGQ